MHKGHIQEDLFRAVLKFISSVATLQKEMALETFTGSPENGGFPYFNGSLTRHFTKSC